MTLFVAVFDFFETRSYCLVLAGWSLLSLVTSFNSVGEDILVLFFIFTVLSREPRVLHAPCIFVSCVLILAKSCQIQHNTKSP